MDNINDKNNNPITIEELQEWYKARNLPPYETTRFFIGINHQGPKAFGIYKDDNGDFIVYKNKENGQRTIRYQGSDEEYAVNELYQKLKEEIIHQKAVNEQEKAMNEQEHVVKGYTPSPEELHEAEWNVKFNKMLKKGCLQMFLSFVLPAVIAVLAALQIIYGFLGKNGIYPLHAMEYGYYTYQESVYYYDEEEDWYFYDYKFEDWELTNDSNPNVQAIIEDFDSYYTTDTWNSDLQVTDVTESVAYIHAQEVRRQSNENNNRDNNSWDNDSWDNNDNDNWDYDWDDNDDWDSDNTDWDSDW